MALNTATTTMKRKRDGSHPRVMASNTGLPHRKKQRLTVQKPPKTKKQGTNRRQPHGLNRPRSTVKLGTVEISDDEDEDETRIRRSRPSEVIDLCSEPECSFSSPTRQEARTINEGDVIVILSSEDEEDSPVVVVPPRLPPLPIRRRVRRLQLNSISPPREEAPPPVSTQVLCDIEESPPPPPVHPLSISTLRSPPTKSSTVQPPSPVQPLSSAQLHSTIISGAPAAAPPSPSVVDLEDDEPQSQPRPIPVYRPGELQQKYDCALSTSITHTDSDLPQTHIRECENPGAIPILTHLFWARSAFGGADKILASRPSGSSSRPPGEPLRSPFILLKELEVEVVDSAMELLHGDAPETPETQGEIVTEDVEMNDSDRCSSEQTLRSRSPTPPSSPTVNPPQSSLPPPLTQPDEEDDADEQEVAAGILSVPPAKINLPTCRSPRKSMKASKLLKELVESNKDSGPSSSGSDTKRDSPAPATPPEIVLHPPPPFSIFELDACSRADKWLNDDILDSDADDTISLSGLELAYPDFPSPVS